MSPEHRKLLHDAIDAHLDGKKVQVMSNGEWADMPNQEGNFWESTSRYLLRPKPEPKTRPWQSPSDVPLGCWMMRVSGGWPCLVTEVDEVAITVGSAPGMRLNWVSLSGWEYSADRINWQPCVVTEP